MQRYAAGDDSALNELLECSMARLEALTNAMFRDFRRLRRWEETGDVLQNALIRLCRALQSARPADVRGFLALASLQIRREFTDLVRHHFGPEGIGSNHDTYGDRAKNRSTAKVVREAVESSSFEPQCLAVWSDFHLQAERLPPAEREVFDLLYYQCLSQTDAAELLQVSERTLQRRWQSARLALHDAFDGQSPN